MAVIYSCCFWFSLRLGGILIAVFCILQGLAVLVSCCIAYSQKQNVKDNTAALIDSLELIYAKAYFDNFYADPEKFLSFAISVSCIYIIICLFYIYGAYKFNNLLMMGFILVELLRLIFIAFIITTCLLVLKENTMDIGIHIGSSVIGSFFMLGMFYLWLCAANLPVLINEMERDQQTVVIQKLRKIINSRNNVSLQEVQDTGATPLSKEFGPYRIPIIATSTKKDFYKSLPFY